MVFIYFKGGITIKRIIFDLDNTLIPWRNDYLLAFKQVLEDYNLDIDYHRQGEITGTYEKKFAQFTLSNMTNYFNQIFKTHIDESFILTWLKYLGKMSSVNPKINELLNYLSKKYELVILTNWFKSSQVKRLENAQMLQYFQEVIGGDDYIKPNPQAFIQAMGEYKPQDCLMVGDSYNVDIEPALKLGLNTLLISPDNQNYNCSTIKDIYELKRIL